MEIAALIRKTRTFLVTVLIKLERIFYIKTFKFSSEEKLWKQIL